MTYCCDTTRDHTLQISVTHILVFSVTVIVALLGIGFQRYRVLGFYYTSNKLYTGSVWLIAVIQLVTTLYRSLSHTDWCSQSRSSLRCLVSASNGIASSASTILPTNYTRDLYELSLWYNSWPHFTDLCHTQISVLSHGHRCAAWYRLPTAPILGGWHLSAAAPELNSPSVLPSSTYRRGPRRQHRLTVTSLLRKLWAG
jgi:hypothetical protein